MAQGAAHCMAVCKIAQQSPRSSTRPRNTRREARHPPREGDPIAFERQLTSLEDLPTRERVPREHEEPAVELNDQASTCRARRGRRRAVEVPRLFAAARGGREDTETCTDRRVRSRGRWRHPDPRGKQRRPGPPSMVQPVQRREPSLDERSNRAQTAATRNVRLVGTGEIGLVAEARSVGTGNHVIRRQPPEKSVDRRNRRSGLERSRIRGFVVRGSWSGTGSKKPGRPQAPRLNTGNWKPTTYLMNSISR